MSEVQRLINMARRGAEDGHDMQWHSMVTDSPRILSLMKAAHLDALKKINEAAKSAPVDDLKVEYEFC